MRLEVSASIGSWSISQNIFCSGKSAVIHMPSLKTSQDRSGSISLIQISKWALGSEKLLHYVRRSAEHVGACYRVISADDATTTTSSYAESEIEAPLI